MMGDIYIHVGMPKTATTFLQQNVFPFIEGVRYLNAIPALRDLVAFDDHDSILISDESLCGLPWRLDGPQNRSWAEDRRLCLSNLARLYPQAKIIIGFRRHVPMIISMYKQYLHEGGALTFEEFFGFEQGAVLGPEDFRYAQVLDQLGSTFKNERYCIDFDEMKDLDSFLKGLSAFLGVEPIKAVRTRERINEGVRGPQSKVLRFLNSYAQTRLNPDGILPLYNRFSTRFGVDPRTLCQKRLRFMSNAKLTIEPALQTRIEDFFNEDWQTVRSEVENRHC